MSKKIGLFSNLKGDLSAGLVVFLIAVPLCLGIALASGAPLYAGMIAGMVGGIVVGTLSKSAVSVSGPAAGLTAIVLTAIGKLGVFELFLLSVVIGGVLQFLLGCLKAGAIANYFPSNVIKGMLTAIGIIIILKQIPHAFGYDRNSEGDFTFIQADGDNTFSALLNSINHIHLGATLITLVSISILLFWGRWKMMRTVPGALVAVVVGVLLNEFFIFSGSFLQLRQEHLVNLPVAADFSSFLEQFTHPDFKGIANKEVWITGITIAIVASIETLLNIEATDKLDPLKRYTPPSHELKAQGIGNIISGLLGGLPITSVIVRSSANIHTGGRTKLSTIIHGVLLLVCAALIPGLLNKIPLATLAAVLLVTGYKLCKISVFKEMWANGKYQWIPFAVTVVAIVSTDLLVGVGLGMAASVFAILRGNMKAPYFFHKAAYHEGDIIRLELAQEVSFLNKASILLTLEALPENSTVIIDASKTVYIDFDVLEILKEFINVKAPQNKIRVVLLGFKQEYNISNTEHIHIEHPLTQPVVPVLGKPHDELLKELQ